MEELIELRSSIIAGDYDAAFRIVDELEEIERVNRRKSGGYYTKDEALPEIINEAFLVL